MSRRAFGPKKTGPDLSWADEDLDDPNERNNRAISPPSNIPGPTFPPRTHKNIIRTPKPLSTREKAATKAQLQFRQRCREGPLFTVLDKNSLLVDGVSRKSEEAKRRGFDPFEQQDRYSTRHLKKARTEPDLGRGGRGDYGYSLSMFPEELWGVLDPEQRSPCWKTVDEGSVAYASLPAARRRGMGEGPRRKRQKVLDYERQDRERVLLREGGDGAVESDEDDEDVVRGGKRKKTKSKKTPGEKRGLDAEDDVEAEPNAEDAEEEAGEDEPEDSDFSEDSDMNDYDAEQYFDAGEDEDDGGDDHGGGEDY